MKAIGFIKLSRDILNWRWYCNANTMRLYFHLLINANFCDAEFETHLIKRGQIVTGRKELAHALKISEQEVRTALDHLKSTNDITIKTTSKYSIITINNYEQYASATNETTNNQPSINHQSTNNQPQYNKYKKNNKYKNNSKTETDKISRSYTLEDFESKSLFTD